MLLLIVEFNYTPNIKDKNLLITPLNWGLGHATRCIPIIKSAIKHCKSVTIASDGIALVALRETFPDIKFIELPSYNIKYKFESMVLNGILQYPKVAQAIKGEKQIVGDIVKADSIEMILSDNRFGCYHPETENIFITHQLNLQHPSSIIRYIINYQNKKWLRNFSSIWVPDYSNSKLSGKLSDPTKFKNVKFIGPQSTYFKTEQSKIIDILFVLSGPEPQRTKLEKELLRIASFLKSYSIVMVSGSQTPPEVNIPENVAYHKFMIGEELNRLYNTSKLLVCRSGYSTIMDIDELKIPNILIPTPGQTEQEYLAKFRHQRNLSDLCRQNQIADQLKIKIEEVLKKFS